MRQSACMYCFRGDVVALLRNVKRKAACGLGLGGLDGRRLDRGTSLSFGGELLWGADSAVTTVELIPESPTAVARSYA